MKHVDRTIIETVYDLHADKLYRFFYFKVLNKHIAEDLTSDVFIALAEKASQLEQDTTIFEKYLYGIARNKWNGYLRQKYKEQSLSVEEIDDFSAYVKEEVDEMQSMSLKDRALYFINLLPPKQKIVATLRLIDGLTPIEISKKIQKPINYVKVTLRRALRRLEELVLAHSMSQDGKESA